MKTILLIILSSIMLHAGAQTQFIKSGRIVYERKINQHKALEEQAANNSILQQIMKVYPKMITDLYELRFNDSRSAYKLIKENPDNKYLNSSIKPTETDGVVQDIKAGSVSAQRDLFENTYIIKDSLRNLEWRITDETREIAGFDCRKAVTKICDSVYVVAFYTDQIPVSSGPEEFGGLPGMILGLAVPRLSATWFATKLELVEPTITQLTPVQKGKTVNWLQLNAELKKGLGKWGKDGERMVWMTSL